MFICDELGGAEVITFKSFSSLVSAFLWENKQFRRGESGNVSVKTMDRNTDLIRFGVHKTNLRHEGRLQPGKTGK